MPADSQSSKEGLCSSTELFDAPFLDSSGCELKTALRTYVGQGPGGIQNGELGAASSNCRDTSKPSTAELAQWLQNSSNFTVCLPQLTPASRSTAAMRRCSPPARAERRRPARLPGALVHSGPVLPCPAASRRTRDTRPRIHFQEKLWCSRLAGTLIIFTCQGRVFQDSDC